ncbi:hypothetical protein [Deinococcus kurensis]|uniref:hypothetical protein n=1 Tax=Deinococcus kurensis TaxID=2662757 RepID=UPI0012D2EFCC|nr:hypothetical protein [Deinococcus kurensis]
MTQTQTDAAARLTAMHDARALLSVPTDALSSEDVLDATDRTLLREQYAAYLGIPVGDLPPTAPLASLITGLEFRVEALRLDYEYGDALFDALGMTPSGPWNALVGGADMHRMATAGPRARLRALAFTYRHGEVARAERLAVEAAAEDQYRRAQAQATQDGQPF